jgi:CheY-like chemotaxis protein
VFNDPVESLSGFKSGPYDLALIDYKMPNMNGFELYREIKKIDDRVKVCFITAFEVYYEELKNRFQHKEEDVKCFIPKPLAIDDLVKKVKEALNLE